MARHTRTGLYVHTQIVLEQVLCSTCRLRFAVPEYIIDGDEPFYCPRGHSDEPPARTGRPFAFLKLPYQDTKIHVEESICKLGDRLWSDGRLTRVEVDKDTHPYRICNRCRSRLSDDRLEDLKQLLARPDWPGW